METVRERVVAPAVALVVLVVSCVLVADQRYLRGEVAVFEWVNGWPRWLGAPLEVVMQLGTLLAGLLVVAGVLAFTPGRGWRPTAVVFAAVITAFVLDDVLKEVIERPRPAVTLPSAVVRDEADGFGFPSGHTTMAFALAAVVHPLLPVRLRWIPSVLATAVGFSRMYVGVHWPMDLVGGAALGIAIGTAASAVGRATTVAADHDPR